MNTRAIVDQIIPERVYKAAIWKKQRDEERATIVLPVGDILLHVVLSRHDLGKWGDSITVRSAWWTDPSIDPMGDDGWAHWQLMYHVILENGRMSFPGTYIVK